MHERDLSGQTRTRARVDQLDMHLLERRQRLDDVRRVEAEVVQPLAATLQEAPYTRRRIERLEQLDLGLTGAQQRGAYVLVRDGRLLEEGQSQRVTVEPVGVREPIHDDADMVDSSHPAQSPLRVRRRATRALPRDAEDAGWRGEDPGRRRGHARA